MSPEGTGKTLRVEELEEKASPTVLTTDDPTGVYLPEDTLQNIYAMRAFLT